MQTSYLKHFVDTARLGSIAAAAQENFITPQGLSRSLSVLENELGCKLFKRRQNKVTLTMYGEGLLEDAVELLKKQSDLLDHVARIRSDELVGAEREVNVYLNNAAFDAAVFRPLIDSFERIFVNARYFQCDNSEVVNNLIASAASPDHLELGLLCLFTPDDDINEPLLAKLRDNGFAYQPYMHSYDECLVSAKSDLATKKALTRADILSRPIVSSMGDVRHVIERLFGKNAIYMVTADSSFRFRVVANDEGITFVPAFHRLELTGEEKTVVVPMKDPYYLELGFAARRDVMENPYIKNVFARLNSYYMQFESSPYLSLVSSELTSFSMAKDIETSGDDTLDKIVREFDISKRERDVLSCLLDGLSAPQIASRLGVSLSTAKSHVFSIYRKTGVHSQKELIARAEEKAIES